MNVSPLIIITNYQWSIAIQAIDGDGDLSAVRRSCHHFALQNMITALRDDNDIVSYSMIYREPLYVVKFRISNVKALESHILSHMLYL